ncbi:MAG TPA: VOC family protein [Vicinamibacterales bacterium]|nr:VOC family protein [Vicinamibacterales bacterium]
MVTRRRAAFVGVVCVALAVAALSAQVPGGRGGPASMTLPLANLGLEHLDIVVPDTAASAKFYMRIFKAPLHQQPVRDTLRYFVVLGDVPADRQVGYVAIGAANDRPAAIGHYCVLAATYGAQAFSAALEAAGQPSKPTAAGPIGMWPDPDGLELQLFQPPAGLVAAAVPSTLETQKDGFIVPRGVDHVMLQVPSLEKSLPYYRALYGTAAERAKDRNGRVWFEFPKNTRIALEPTAGKPAISHYAIKVAPFDRAALATRLAEAGSAVMPSPDEPDVVRFKDKDGITVELKVAE